MMAKRCWLSCLALVLAAVIACAGPALAGGKFVDDGKLVYSVYTDIQTMDPHVAFVWYSCTITRNTHEGLLQYNLKDFSIKPLLAESWKLDENGGTFNLRKGVKFSDGTEFDAAAVKFNLERIKALNKGPATWVKDIKGVKIIDKHTVRLETTKNWAFLEDVLAAPWCFIMVSPAAIKKNATKDDPWATKWMHDHTAGTGPYVVEKWAPNQYIKMVRNKDYWRGWNGKHFSEVVYQVNKEDSTERMLITRGAVDMINDMTAEYWDVLAADPHIKVKTFPSLAEQFILMNNARGPLADENMRKAVTYAVDYEACRAVVNASAKGLLVGTPIKRDVAKAKAFKAKSAYAGKEVTLKLCYVSGIENHRKWSLILQDNLKDIGVKLDIQSMTWPAFAKQVYGTPDQAADLYPFYASSIIADPYGVLYKVLDSHSLQKGGANLGYKSAEFDAMMNKASQTIDRQKRMAIYQQARLLPEKDATYLWLFMLPYVAIYRDNVGVYDYTQIGDALGNMFYFYDYYRK